MTDSPPLEDQDRNPAVEHYDVNLTKLRSLTEHNAGHVKSIATVFLGNLEKIHELHLMPYLTAADGVRLFFWTVNYVQAALQSGKRGSDAIEENTKVAEELFAAFLKEPETTTTIASHIDDRIASLMRHESFQRALRVMFFITTPLLWTAFETLARDAWITAIDAGPVSIARRTFRSLDDDEVDDGILKKSIEVGILAKHDFDLRGRLGTILQDKFHFSSIEGISKAYHAAFPNESAFLATLENNDLKSAEQVRHLITHKAGIIDDKYKKRTSTSQNMGEELVLTGAQVSRFGQAVVEVGISLLVFVDNFLTYNPK
jgi:hypothetical protein